MNGKMTRPNWRLNFDVTTSMEKWPAEIGTLYFDVTTLMENCPAQIGAYYFDVTT